MAKQQNQPRDKQQVSQVMEEVGQELGVNEQQTESPRQAKKVADQLKQEIRKRK